MDKETALALVDYLMREIPGDGRGGWDDEATSAYSEGLDLLDRLGYAEIGISRYATRVPDPQLPAILPRHDDACALLIGLAHQQSDIRFRKPGGEDGARIQAGPGTWAADASDEVAGLLERLGLVAGGAWTADAETVLWRAWPYEWPEPDFSTDARVISAIERARDIPDDVQQLIDEAMARPEPELRRYFLQRAVEERWRLAEGWITEGPDDPAPVYILHDPLAVHACGRVFGEMMASHSAA